MQLKHVTYVAAAPSVSIEFKDNEVAHTEIVNEYGRPLHEREYSFFLQLRILRDLPNRFNMYTPE